MRTATNVPFKTSVLSYSNYYPFGMQYPDIDASTTQNATYQSAEYRYGYNGKEKDGELKGEGNSYDYDARIYDPRIVRWMSTDSKKKKYAGISPFSFAANSPIYLTDGNGEDVLIFSKQNQLLVRIKNDQEDVGYRLNFVTAYYKDHAPLYIDARVKKDGAPDAVSIKAGASFVVGGGISYGVEAVLFLRGKDAGSIGFYSNYGGRVGAEISASIGIQPAFFVNTKPQNQHLFSADRYGGIGLSYSGGVGPISGELSWSVTDDALSQGDLFNPASENVTWRSVAYSPTGLSVANVGLSALRQAFGEVEVDVGLSWGFSNSSLLGTVSLGDMATSIPKVTLSIAPLPPVDLSVDKLSKQETTKLTTPDKPVKASGVGGAEYVP